MTIWEVANILIYKITNKINGKIYIGQTTRTLDERISEHKRHRQCIVGRAFSKYGEENLLVEVIDYATNIDELNAKEIKWIEFYNCIIPYGYNQCVGGKNTIGFHHREESKRKMSELKKQSYLGIGNPFFGKTHSDEQRAKWKEERKTTHKEYMQKAQKASIESIKVKVINLDTNEVFNSIKEAAESCGTKSTHISRVCRGGRFHTGGYRWAYAN